MIDYFIFYFTVDLCPFWLCHSFSSPVYLCSTSGENSTVPRLQLGQFFARPEFLNSTNKLLFQICFKKNFVSRIISSLKQGSDIHSSQLYFNFFRGEEHLQSILYITFHLRLVKF